MKSQLTKSRRSFQEVIVQSDEQSDRSMADEAAGIDG